jgi:hypothetical protein
MKDMNTMKFLAKRIVNLYMNRALMGKTQALEELFNVCHQSEGAQAYKELNEHGKFVKRFHDWWIELEYKRASDILNDMDVFFEKEDYYWEDLYVGSN